ncbi:hypothetical protein LEMA_P003660.1 [Plenodomus lingam JN3]|uniref:Uncharacterized protein n=2 Tax=Leptosphaeria maculans TaxID=5022 RepID=E5AEE0_LEPMJ|nr:hypothetical protein LEMA_P003660.1 [Plenodomus lingam JN3]CBY01579.1 hypothetical protein LEMA_P003660.1 [Plenodomus lingam JN3]
MANNNNNNDNDRSLGRDPGRPEDSNPFIAFRRFADSHVSSLLNTVFTLPATIANYNQAHQAREQCLFGKADERKCDQLHEIEADTAELRRQGRELLGQGDVKAVLEHSDLLLKLERKAEDIRRDIVQEATRNGHLSPDGRHDSVALVERVASQKGRDWGAEWDWGIPKPFDSGRRAVEGNDEDERSREMHEWELLLRLQSEVQRLVAAFDGAAWDDPPRQQSSDSSAEKHDAHNRSWVPLWESSLPRDTPRTKVGMSWPETNEDPMSKSAHSVQTCSRSKEPHDEPSYEYSHDHEDQHDEPPSPKHNLTCSSLQQQQHLHRPDRGADTSYASSRNLAAEQTEMDAYEQLVGGLDKPSPSISPPAFAQRHDPNSTSSILSTLTTTERTVTPDGLVTTKVVLKKRFADGREESTETVHTQKSEDMNPRSQDVSKPSIQPHQTFNDADETTKKASRTGWFWSS